MPRVRPRSNIYALLPILATLVIAFGITLTWMRIAEYMREPVETPVPPAPPRQHPGPPTLPTTKEAPAVPAPGTGEEAAPEEAAPTEGAPTEGAPTTTPEVKPAPGTTPAPAPGVTPGARTLDEEDEP